MQYVLCIRGWPWPGTWKPENPTRKLLTRPDLRLFLQNPNWPDTRNMKLDPTWPETWKMSIWFWYVLTSFSIFSLEILHYKLCKSSMGIKYLWCEVKKLKSMHFFFTRNYPKLEILNQTRPETWKYIFQKTRLTRNPKKVDPINLYYA